MTFATISDIEKRYPVELITLAADETTGVMDPERVQEALMDATSEVTGVLQARYSRKDLAHLTPESLSVLRVYTIDIALYRVALSFARSNDRIEERYKNAILRLEAIAKGKGGLSLLTDGAGGMGQGDGAPSSPNEVLFEAPERVFTRSRLRGA